MKVSRWVMLACRRHSGRRPRRRRRAHQERFGVCGGEGKVQGRADQRHRQVQRQVVQPVAAGGLAAGEGEARRRHPSAAVEVVSQYIPNLDKAVRQKSDIVISAGFLLANDTATYAKKFPNTKFAITD